MIYPVGHKALNVFRYEYSIFRRRRLGLAAFFWKVAIRILEYPVNPV